MIYLWMDGVPRSIGLPQFDSGGHWQQQQQQQQLLRRRRRKIEKTAE
jgi:hypothetical protein